MRGIYIIFLMEIILQNVRCQMNQFHNEENITYIGVPDFAFKSTPVEYPGDPVIGFAWKIFRASKQPNLNDNLILSPILIQFLLSILELTSAGETKNQFQQVIGGKTAQNLKGYLTPANKIDLSVATGLFVDKTKNLNVTFVNQVKELGAVVFASDFFNEPEESKIEINKWASDATYGQIQNLLSPSFDLHGTELIITSAVYFHNTWKYRFNSIGNLPFYTNSNLKINTEFMETSQWYVSGQISSGDGIFIEIPYEGENYSMLIIYPEKPLDIFIKNFDINNFEDLIKSLNNTTAKLIKLQIPKFKINTKFSVVNAVIKMGLVNLFTTNSKLPYLSSNQLKLNDIIQQVVLNVDETGTIATAAIASFLVPLTVGGSSLKTLTINRPFVAVIIDKTKNVPLFIGKINVLE